jgi:hypothetical protein
MKADTIIACISKSRYHAKTKYALRAYRGTLGRTDRRFIERAATTKACNSHSKQPLFLGVLVKPFQVGAKRVYVCSSLGLAL